MVREVGEVGRKASEDAHALIPEPVNQIPW